MILCTEIADDEILLRVETNGICLSTHKAAMLGAEHMRVPHNIAAVNDEHLPLLTNLAIICCDMENVEKLVAATDPQQVIDILTAVDASLFAEESPHRP